MWCPPVFDNHAYIPYLTGVQYIKRPALNTDKYCISYHIPEENHATK